MEIDERNTIRLSPYRRRHTGLSVGEIFELRLILAFIQAVQRLCVQLPVGALRNGVICFIFGLYGIVLGRIMNDREEVRPVNPRNRNRLFDSFTDEECWHYLRFRKTELSELLILCDFPAIIVCKNGTSCPGEHAFCILLYRIAYPSRLFELQEIFGRDYSQISRIFKWSIDFMHLKHKNKVECNLSWYTERFDMYHQSIIKKVLESPRNPNRGFIPQEVSNIFAFLDGTGLEIARPGNGAQNPFWNGYMHGHYLIFQGISFPDGMVVIEGAFPGYQPDTMIWRDSEMREELENIMADRAAEGRARYKIYADKIYSNSVLITAAYSRRHHRHGLQDWQIRLNRLMSDIRVGVEWSFGKIIARNKYVSYGQSMKIQGSPVSKYYHIAVLLANAHTCMFGCQQTSYFGVSPPDVNEYFDQ